MTIGPYAYSRERTFAASVLLMSPVIGALLASDTVGSVWRREGGGDEVAPKIAV